ncbi:MAG: glycogen synthase GlgA [Candidatus Acidiferrales bacterium]
MKILFVSSEGLPFSKTGGLADVVGSLPKALHELGHQVAVFLPRYRGNKEGKPVVSSITISLGTRMRFPALVDGGAIEGVHYFFLDDPEYFDREQLYGEKGVDYADNPERFAEFSRAAVEFSKHGWRPDVIHCHDWQSALVPVLLRTQYAADPMVNSIPVIFTVHNIGYQGLFPKSVLWRVGLPEDLFRVDALEYYSKVNFLKGGMIFADELTTVSRKYAQEIQTPEYGLGMEGIVSGRGEHLSGILNGVDYSAWSPEVDTHLVAQYSAKNMAGKRLCKKDLLAAFNLPVENLDRPLVGIVSRFVDQKGFDLIAEVSGVLMEENLTLVALGAGEPKYEEMFSALAAKYPEKVGVKVGYDNALAHKIEGGADMFLMPSRYEPCGLNQIYSLRYGTVPVVRATGGLDDTIENFDATAGGGTGFKFEAYTGEALLHCLRSALDTFRDPRVWRAIQASGMSKDFSWSKAADEYVRLYESARSERIPRAASTSNA